MVDVYNYIIRVANILTFIYLRKFLWRMPHATPPIFTIFGFFAVAAQATALTIVVPTAVPIYR